MNYWIILLCVALSFTSQAQEVTKDGTTYEVKDEKIFLDGKDVTEMFTIEERKDMLKRAAEIATSIKIKQKEVKEAKKAEKEQKKLIKDKKRAEKKQKHAEKALKKKKKAQSNYNKATKKYEQAQDKYQKLKKKGKLSPEDETKWLEKIEKLNKKITSLEKKLKRA